MRKKLSLEKTLINNGRYDSIKADESLKKIAIGTGAFFIGQTLFYLLSFIGAILIIRTWSQDEFGIYSLCLTIIYICSTSATIGMNQGVVKNIASSRAKHEKTKISQIIYSSILISLTVSIIIFILLFIFSEIISEHVFNKIELTTPLKILSLSIPFFAILYIICAIFRGFDKVRQTVYFEYILFYTLSSIFIVLIILLKLPFIYVYYLTLAAIILTILLLMIYIFKKIPSWVIDSKEKLDIKLTKELLIFSIPLFFSVLIITINTNLNILLLGIWKSSVDVAIYSAIRPLSMIISIFLFPLLLIFMPIFSGLFIKGLISEMRRNYALITKWINFVSLPLFLIIILYPKIILDSLFGVEYNIGDTALMIICIGVFFNNFIGPCATTLITMNKPRFVLFTSIICLILNIILCYILIPPYGIIGAAISFTFASIVVNIINTSGIYFAAKIQPINKNLIKMIVPSLIIIICLHFIIKNFIIIKWWMVPVLLVLYYLIEIIFLILTKSLDQEDKNLLLSLEKKMGVKKSLLEKIFIKLSKT